MGVPSRGSKCRARSDPVKEWRSDGVKSLHHYNLWEQKHSEKVKQEIEQWMYCINIKEQFDVRFMTKAPVFSRQVFNMFQTRSFYLVFLSHAMLSFSVIYFFFKRVHFIIIYRNLKESYIFAIQIWGSHNLVQILNHIKNGSGGRKQKQNQKAETTRFKTLWTSVNFVFLYSRCTSFSRYAHFFFYIIPVPCSKW